jgi:hypothetical protein
MLTIINILSAYDGPQACAFPELHGYLFTPILTGFRQAKHSSTQREAGRIEKQPSSTKLADVHIVLITPTVRGFSFVGWVISLLTIPIYQFCTI